MDSQTLSDEWRRKHRYFYTRDGTIGIIDGSEFIPMTPEEAVDVMNGGRAPRVIAKPDPTPETGWSEWLTNGGVRCPLPENTLVDWDNEPTRPMRAGYWDWMSRHGHRFRYREDAVGGWVSRPEGWTPPASLWAEGSPVRCILRTDNTECDLKAPPAHWDGFTHIRLLPRAPASEPAPEMPEGFEVAEDGALRSEVGTMISRYEIDRYGPDTIRAAVEAWLKEMERR